MAVQRREYLLTVNRFKEPEVIKDKEAVAMLLLRLIIMEPGTDPLHPGMGVGIKRYRYGLDNIATVKAKVTEQVETYLPYFSDSEINFSYGDNHTLKVEITVGDTTYVYETSGDDLPVGLEDIANG